MLHDEWQKFLAATAESAGTGSAPPTAERGAWLQSWAVLRFCGADARSFLQGYLTSDTATLEPQRLQPTAICNLKGRVVINGWCCAVGEQDVRLLVHASLVERLSAFLRPYLMFAKTRLEDETPNLLAIGVLDPGTETPGLTLEPRRRIILCEKLGDARDQWTRLTPISETEWQAALIADGIPLITEKTTETFLPQMLGLDAAGAVSFSKGCYLGQEVVARAQHRGVVKRRLCRLAWSTDRTLEPGQSIEDAAGRSVGTVINAVTEAGKGQCLAVVQIDQGGGLRQGDTDLRSIP